MDSILKLLFQNFQTFIRILISVVKIQDHIEQPPGILMTHICFSNLIQHPFFIVHISANLCSQIQIITVCQRIFSDCAPIIIVILKNPFCFFRLASEQIDITKHQLIYFIQRIQLTQCYHLLDRTIHPVFQCHSSCHISYIFFDDLSQ